ncbi:MAG TPA: hypothetical protein ACFYED_02820 [Candidatus Tripitaka californicus]|uniref:hypothetical protein n=1 Tax=Candidatus Tripitaka californicus TaxID=3367616 RepID=UPI00402519E6|nr:hypothetical protein [Planctomycetota bacterium]
MDRQRKLLLGVLAVLFVIVVIVNYRNLKGSPPVTREVAAPARERGGGRAAARPKDKEEKGAPEAPVVTLAKFEPIPMDTGLLESQQDKGQWGREPFLTPEEIHPVVIEEGPPEIEGPLPTVSSILIDSNGQKAAIINGQWYSEGAAILGTEYRVATITPEGVLLEKADKQRMKQLRPNPVEGKIRSREK